MRVPWVEKYRPTRLEDFALEESMIDIFSRFTSDTLSHLILSGGSGIGKTSIAFFICRSNKLCFREYNASDARGIAAIQEIMKYNQSMGADSKTCVILDEADNLTTKAQELIVHHMDNYPNMIFIMTCNCTKDIIEDISERCTTIQILVKKSAIESRISDILEKEGVRCSPESIRNIAEYSNDDIRLMINRLESISYVTNHISEEIVDVYCKHPCHADVKEIFDIVLTGNADRIISHYVKKKCTGLNIKDTVHYLIGALTNNPPAIIPAPTRIAVLERLHLHLFITKARQVDTDMQFLSLLCWITDQFYPAS
jgi:replication factor C subunit 3/5